MPTVSITITTIHLENPKKAKDYAQEKISKLSRYNSKIEKIEVRLIGEKSHRDKNTDFTCEVKIALPGHDLEIKDTEQTILAAIDKAEDRAKRLLVKNKEKHLARNHQRGIVGRIRKRLPF